MGDGITGLSIILSSLLSGIAWFCSYSSPRTFPLVGLHESWTVREQSKVRAWPRSLDPIDSIG